MKPRAAGTIGIVVALALAVLGGYLLARPPWSIPGALVLVLASIALSVGIVWTRRKSWAEPWPPDMTPSLQKVLRAAKVFLVMNCGLVVAAIGLAVVSIGTEQWDQLFLAGFWALVSTYNLTLGRKRLRVLLRQETQESGSHVVHRAPAPEDESTR